MNMNPSNIITCKIFHIEKLRISFSYFNKLILFFKNFFSLLNNTAFYPLILNELQFIVLPEYDIINLFWKITDQMIPL
jgi:hypothetical protein